MKTSNATMVCESCVQQSTETMRKQIEHKYMRNHCPSFALISSCVKCTLRIPSSTITSAQLVGSLSQSWPWVGYFQIMGHRLSTLLLLRMKCVHVMYTHVHTCMHAHTHGGMRWIWWDLIPAVHCSLHQRKPSLPATSLNALVWQQGQKSLLPLALSISCLMFDTSCWEALLGWKLCTNSAQSDEPLGRTKLRLSWNCTKSQRVSVVGL